MTTDSGERLVSSDDSAPVGEDILIVDDEPADLQLLRGMLEEAGYRVRSAECSQSALDSARSSPPSLILLNVKMPEANGFEVCRRLKEGEGTRDIPIIFVSAQRDIEERVRGFEAGGVDFISKPLLELELLARVRPHVELRAMREHTAQLVAKRTVELAQSEASLEEAQQLSRIGSWSWVVETDTVTWSKMLFDLAGIDPKTSPPLI